jgi:hypothetical protein
MTEYAKYLEERKKLLRKPKSDFMMFCQETNKLTFFNRYGTELQNWELFHMGYKTLKDIKANPKIRIRPQNYK